MEKYRVNERISPTDGNPASAVISSGPIRFLSAPPETRAAVFQAEYQRHIVPSVNILTCRSITAAPQILFLIR